jgi:hypothetical protein
MPSAKNDDTPSLPTAQCRIEFQFNRQRVRMMASKRSDRGDGRDAKGRWVKGTTGNRSGRPPKIPDYDMADVYNFSQFPTEITIGGEQQLMTRHEVVLLKLFETALKGRITAQKYLIEKFEEARMSKEYLQLWLEKSAERLAEDPESVPQEVVQMMQRVLNSQDRPRSRIRTRTMIRPQQDGKRKRN